MHVKDNDPSVQLCKLTHQLSMMEPRPPLRFVWQPERVRRVPVDRDDSDLFGNSPGAAQLEKPVKPDIFFQMSRLHDYVGNEPDKRCEQAQRQRPGHHWHG
ncbi:hypothetical protein GCM10011348_26760 [Marinobacterium nitratireducens]|uniref:Uncharacterized protein n=1 Tax=Marinobacterium nitratireducens TaxID=518897 RepID=A0A918DU17_9GAMM|nr:hypothetical protein GCM10011348_26760 [Marinobacterium nitratireducens]